MGRSVAFQGGDPQPREEEEERSGRLKALLREYFQRDPHGPKGGEEEEEEEEEEDEGLSAAEVSIACPQFWAFQSVPVQPSSSQSSPDCPSPSQSIPVHPSLPHSPAQFIPVHPSQP